MALLLEGATMQIIKQLFLFLLMLPTPTQPWGIPGSATLMKLYLKVSPLLTAVSKSESPKKDPISLIQDPSALIAGSAAACSIGISNQAMNTKTIRRLLERIPPTRNPHLRSAPGLILSTAVGIAAFQVLYLSGIAAHRKASKP